MTIDGDNRLDSLIGTAYLEDRLSAHPRSPFQGAISGDRLDTKDFRRRRPKRVVPSDDVSGPLGGRKGRQGGEGSAWEEVRFRGKPVGLVKVAVDFDFGIPSLPRA